jgi:hypothetical protein
MGNFLQNLGVLFLTGLAFLAVLVLYLWWKFRGLMQGLKAAAGAMTAAGSMTPSRISLATEDEPEWEDEDAVHALADELPKLGFKDAGTFAVEEIPGLKLWAWVDPPGGLYSVVYEHPVAGVWMDYVTYYQDGTSLTGSNSTRGGRLDQRPGHAKLYAPGADARTLHQRMVSERPGGPRKTPSAAEFPAAFEKAYADEMAWRDSRGGPTEREVRAVAAMSGDDYDDGVIEATRQLMQRQALDRLGETLRERFLEESAMPAAEWERVRDRVVIVHDRLTPEMLADAVNELSEEEVDPSDFPEEAPPRRSFASYNDQLPPGRRFRKLGTLKEPLEAEVYCAPEG